MDSHTLTGDSKFLTGPKTKRCFAFRNWVWSEVTTLMQPRAYGSTVKLTDGRLLLAGGLVNDDISRTSEFITWTGQKYMVEKGPSILTRRLGHCSTGAPGLELLQIGGFDGKDFQSQVEEFDEVGKRWKVKTSSKLREPRFDQVCALMTDAYGKPSKVMILGGYGKDGYINTTESLDLTNFVWTEAGETLQDKSMANVLLDDHVPNIGRSAGIFITEHGKIALFGGTICGHADLKMDKQECKRTNRMVEVDQDGINMEAIQTILSEKKYSFAFTSIPRSDICI